MRDRIDIGYDSDFYQAEVRYGRQSYKYDFRKSGAKMIGGSALALAAMYLY